VAVGRVIASHVWWPPRRLRHLTHWPMLANAISLLATTVVTSGLGYAYWVLAAKLFPAEAVGFAAAAISAMTLLGTLGMMGLGTLLIGELRESPGRELSLIVTGVMVAGVVGGTLGGAFALLVHIVSGDLAPLGASLGAVLLFGLGVGLTSFGQVLDFAVIGLLRGSWQLGRNTVFSVTKLVALLVLGIGAFSTNGLGLYSSWVMGSLMSLIAMCALARGSRGVPGVWTPEWGLLRKLGRAALGHHALNIALMSPYQLLPLLVAVLLSTTQTAYFYMAFMLASLIFALPGHLATALYASGGRSPHELARRLRLSLALGTGASLAANAILFFGADWILGIFGPAYVSEASATLRLLALAGLPLIVKDHYVALLRLSRRAGQAAVAVAAGGILELAMGSAGALLGGLTGLSLGWLVAGCVEAVLMAPIIYRAALPPGSDDVPSIRREEMVSANL